MKFFIRDFQKRDAPQVIEIYQQAFAEPPWNETWPSEDVQKDIDKCLAEKNPAFLVAECEGKIVGFRWAYELKPEQFPFLPIERGEAMYGDELALKKEFRGNGIATEMMRMSLEFAQNRGYKNFWGRTDRNSKTNPIYRRLGYVFSGIEDPKLKGRLYFMKDLGVD